MARMLVELRVADGVWAVGDVTGIAMLTHVGKYQARIAVADILGRAGESADYRAAPAVTFTDPEIASVGLTESAAHARGLRTRTATTQIQSSARGWIHDGGNEGLIKLVADAPFGPGNVENLRLAVEAAREGIRTIAIDQVPVEERDFTGGRATALWHELRALAETVRTIEELSGALAGSFRGRS